MSIKTFYRGYIIECDDEFGYIVTKNGKDLCDGFPTKQEARSLIDEMVRDTREYQRG